MSAKQTFNAGDQVRLLEQNGTHTEGIITDVQGGNLYIKLLTSTHYELETFENSYYVLPVHVSTNRLVKVNE